MEENSEIEDLKELVKHYKFSSESFEKRVLDLQKELLQKDEEIKMWKDKYQAGLAARKDTSHQNLDEGDEPLSMRKLFVGGLSQEATSDSLAEYFSNYGTVQDATVVKDNVTQKSRGFGFVVFTHSHMTDCAQSARPHRILGKEVDTKRAIPKSTIDAGLLPKNPHIQSRRVFIGGLRQSTTSEAISQYFSDFGEVLTVDLIEDSSNGKSRGFAYVTFSDSDSTDKVIVQKYHNIDSRKCEAKPAFHKVSKGQYHEPQPPPPFNNYNDFQALFGAMQQQQHYYNNNQGGGYNNGNKGSYNNNNNGCPHDPDDKIKCFHCDNGSAGAEAWNTATSPPPTPAAPAAAAYMAYDPRYPGNFGNYYNNNNNPRNFKNKPNYHQKTKPY